MSESDGIEETMEQVLQHGMAISAQLGREISRVWQTRMEQKARMTGHESARLQLAYDAEKGSALAALKPVHDAAWWDQAKAPEVIEAYRVASAWRDHDPAAATAEDVIRTQASERYGIDAGKLAAEATTHAAPVLQVDPARLAAAQKWAVESGYESTIPSYYPEANKLAGMMGDFERDQQRQEDAARDAEGNAVRDRQEGTEQGKEAGTEYSQAGRKMDSAAVAEFDGPSAAEEAWYRDMFLAELPEAQKSHDRATADTETAEKHERLGDRAALRAGLAYDSAERQETLAAKMRAAGAPEKGIQARQFAESQQKHPISHAAAGEGKTVNKVRTNSPKNNQAKGKQVTR